MSDDEKESKDEEVFIFETSEKPDLSEYDGLESFKFKDETEKLDLSEYDGLESFKFEGVTEKPEDKDITEIKYTQNNKEDFWNIEDKKSYGFSGSINTKETNKEYNGIKMSQIKIDNMNSKINYNNNLNQNKSSLKLRDVLFLQQDEFEQIARLTIKYIKEKLRINHNNFIEYHNHIKQNQINVDEIINKMFVNDKFIDLLRKIKGNPNKIEIKQERRCIEVISFALLKCPNFLSLFNYLKTRLGIAKRQVWRLINKYIPLLERINPEINIQIWLPKEKNSSTSYEDCEKLGDSRDDLEFYMTREEFNKAMDNRGKKSPSQVPLKWRCTKDPEHIWSATYNDIKNGTGCRYCRGAIAITYEDCATLGNSRDDLEFYMTREEFNKAMDNRGKKNPSYVSLKWRCMKNPEHIWPATYKRIKRGSGCRYCHGTIAITYEDCVTLGDSRDDLEFYMTKEEFNKAMDNRSEKTPAFVSLKWQCAKYPEHIWSATYNNIKKPRGCPDCFGNNPITYEDCVMLGNSREDLRFCMTKEEFNDTMDNRGKNEPSKIPLNWQCTKYPEHLWPATYSNIKGGRGCRYCGDFYSLVGTYLHKAIQYILTHFFLILDRKCFSEIYMKTDPFLNKEYRVDSFLFNKNYILNRLMN
ncbi:MAG: hypothetical protein ACFFDH_25120, partial [Promethearchaeota archaeon]